MTKSDDDRPVDPDRAAILARRQQFIALALTGLATACTANTPPQACLRVAMPEDQQAPQPESEPEPPPVAPPTPCLNVAGPVKPSDEPQPVQPTTVEPIPPEPPPKSKPTPTPKKPKPRPCLNIMRNDGDD